jgi:hypothetical protein
MKRRHRPAAEKRARAPVRISASKTRSDTLGETLREAAGGRLTQGKTGVCSSQQTSVRDDAAGHEYHREKGAHTIPSAFASYSGGGTTPSPRYDCCVARSFATSVRSSTTSARSASSPSAADGTARRVRLQHTMQPTMDTTRSATDATAMYKMARSESGPAVLVAVAVARRRMAALDRA